MRPGPCAPLAGLPPFVRGVATVRGRATPVVDLRRLLEGQGEGAPARWIVSSGPRPAALAVSEVVGVHALAAPEPLPPLLRDAPAALRAVARLDEGLAHVLDAARCVPEEAWAAASGAGGAPA